MGLGAWIDNFVLRNAVKSIKPAQRTGLYPQTFKHIGILADFRQPKHAEYALQFRQELIQKGYQVDMMVFMADPIPNRVPQIAYVTQKDFSFWLKPKRTDIQQFTKKRFDVLINFYTQAIPAFYVVSARNPSGMRIASQEVEYIADVFIKPKANHALSDYKKAIFDYIKL